MRVEKGLSISCPPGSKCWQASFRINGKLERRSTEVPHRGREAGKSEASRAARSLRDSVRQATENKQGALDGDFITATILEALDKVRFLGKKGVLDANDAPIYGDAYENALTLWVNDGGLCWTALHRYFEPDSGALNLRLVDGDKIRSFYGHCNARDCTPKSAARYLKVYKRGLKLAARKHKFVMPVSDVEWEDIFDVPDSKPNEKRSSKYREPELLKRFIALLGADTEVGAQVIIAAHTGVREAELYRLTMDSIDTSDATVDCPAVLSVDSKVERKERFVRVPQEAWNVLLAHLARRTPEQVEAGQVWSGKDHRKIMERASRDLGCEHNITFRDLRATWGTEAKKANVSKSDRMLQMGHTTEASHERYMKAIRQMKVEAARAIIFVRPSLF